MATQEDLEMLEDEVTEVEPGAYVPWMYQWSKVSHYYGDSVRGLLLASAAIMLVGAPFYADDLSIEFPFIILGVLVLVSVAALTSPLKRNVISADAVASGVGLIIFEMWALLGYADSNLMQFVLREALALIFLFALYFSTKTLRAMVLNQVGVRDHSTRLHRPGQRDKSIESRLDAEERRIKTQEEIFEHNEEEKHLYDG